jgi:hypothetical protein
MAAKAGDLATVRALLDSGIDVNAKSSDGWTALDHAVNNGHTLVARLLQERGGRKSRLLLRERVWTVSQARRLKAIAGVLASNSTAWADNPLGATDEAGEGVRRSRALWVHTVSAGAILVGLAQSGDLDRLPRLRTVVLERWAEVKREAASGRIPHPHIPGVPEQSLDLRLSEACVEMVRVWRGKHKGPVWYPGREAEASRIIADGLRALSMQLLEWSRLAKEETDT